MDALLCPRQASGGWCVQDVWSVPVFFWTEAWGQVRRAVTSRAGANPQNSCENRGKCGHVDIETYRKYLTWWYNSQSASFHITGYWCLYLRAVSWRWRFYFTSNLQRCFCQDDDREGKQLDSQAAHQHHHHLLLLLLSRRWQMTWRHRSLCQPAKEDPLAPEEHPSPSAGLGVCWAQSATNTELIRAQAFVDVSIVCDLVSADWIFGFFFKVSRKWWRNPGLFWCTLIKIHKQMFSVWSKMTLTYGPVWGNVLFHFTAGSNNTGFMPLQHLFIRYIYCYSQQLAELLNSSFRTLIGTYFHKSFFMFHWKI